MTDITEEQVAEFVGLFATADDAVASIKRYQKDRLSLSKGILARYSSQPVVVKAQNISKTYSLKKQKIEVLKDISFEVHKGEFIAITGRSGSGKSTLLQLIGCLDKPTSGRIEIVGKDTSKLNDLSLSQLRMRAIGFVFQSFYLQPFLSVRDNIAVPAMFKNVKKDEMYSSVENLLGQVGLDDRSTHLPSELSGGQIQRVAIARALINNPEIILADEPTGNLDSANSERIIQIFKTIRQKLGTTIIVVTHSSEIAAQADRVIEMNDGQII